MGDGEQNVPGISTRRQRAEFRTYFAQLYVSGASLILILDPELALKVKWAPVN